MKNEIQAGNADGLNVDFRRHRHLAKQFPHLSRRADDLPAQLDSGSEVTFAGPALTSGLNTTAVADACDGIFIMGYAFAGSWSTTSAPNAPLIGGSINITNTVEVQWGAVTRTARRS